MMCNPLILAETLILGPITKHQMTTSTNTIANPNSVATTSSIISESTTPASVLATAT